MIVWTNHAKERLRQRGISFSEADQSVRFPSKIIEGGTSRKFIKNFNSYSIVVAVKREGNDWIVASTWKKPHGPAQYDKSLLEKLIRYCLDRLEDLIKGR